MNKDAFNELATVVGATKRQRELNQLVRNISNNSKDSLSYMPVTINGVNKNLTIYSATMDNKKYICSECGSSFNIGDIVSVNNSNWLILRAGAMDQGYQRGYMERCNYTLKWQDNTGAIKEADCIVLTASQYNSGEYAIKDVTIGYNQFMVYLPLNQDTIKIKINDRFFIDNDNTSPVPYRMTRIDTVSMSFQGVGCIAFIATEDQIESDDNIELKICNYKENTTPVVSDIKIEYIGNPTVFCGGNYKTFKTNVDVVFDIVVEGDDNIEFIQTNNRTCKIKCKNVTSMIGRTIKLSCTDGTNIGELYIDIISNV